MYLIDGCPVRFGHPVLCLAVTTWQERLRDAVVRSGQKHSIIALDAGVAPETLSRLLNDPHQRPSLDTITKVAHAVNENVGWLLGERGFMLSARQLAELRGTVDFLRTALLDAPSPRVIVQSNPNAIRARRRVPREFAGATLCFQITDDSMTGAALADGDFLFVEPTRDLRAAAGRVVVAEVGGLLYVKQLELRGDAPRLLSRNDRYAPVELHANELALIGVVVGRAGAPAEK